MAHKKIEAAYISYSYNSRGYMMYYKGKPIGGGGISKSAKGCVSNVSLFRSYAEATKAQILSGNAGELMMKEIQSIDAAEREGATP